VLCCGCCCVEAFVVVVSPSTNAVGPPAAANSHSR
jgi:hypothetical protein